MKVLTCNKNLTAGLPEGQKFAVGIFRGITIK